MIRTLFPTINEMFEAKNGNTINTKKIIIKIKKVVLSKSTFIYFSQKSRRIILHTNKTFKKLLILTQVIFRFR
jgi:hypothetical protein